MKVFFYLFFCQLAPKCPWVWRTSLRCTEVIRPTSAANTVLLKIPTWLWCSGSWYVPSTYLKHFHFACQIIDRSFTKTTVALNYLSMNVSVVPVVDEWGSRTVTSPCRRWTRTRPTRTTSALQGTPAVRHWPSWLPDFRTRGSFSVRSTALQRASARPGPT